MTDLFDPIQAAQHYISTRSNDACEIIQNLLDLIQPQQTDDSFNRFWSLYPKKVGKKNCEKIWHNRKLAGLTEMICADVTRRRIDDHQWRSGYIPNPQTYLNGDRWEDDIQTGVKNESATDAALRTWRERNSGKTFSDDSGAIRGDIHDRPDRSGSTEIMDKSLVTKLSWEK